jgi:hypothetical protein
MGINYSHSIIPRDNAARPEPERVVALIDAWIEKGFVVPPETEQAQHPSQSTRRKSQTGARFMTSPLLEAALNQQQAPERPRGFWARLSGKARKPPRPEPWMPFSVPPAGDQLLVLAHPCALIEWDGDPRATYPMQTMTEAMARGDDQWPHQLIIELSDDFTNPHTDPFGGGAKQVDPTCNCGCNLAYEDTLGWLATEKIRRVCPACGRIFRPEDQVAEIVNGITGARSPQSGGLCSRFAIIASFGKEWARYMGDQEGKNLSEPKATRLFLDTCGAALGIELNEFSYYG